MPRVEELKDAMPVAPLKIIALKSAKTMGDNINRHLVAYRKAVDNKFKLIYCHLH